MRLFGFGRREKPAPQEDYLKETPSAATEALEERSNNLGDVMNKAALEGALRHYNRSHPDAPKKSVDELTVEDRGDYAAMIDADQKWSFGRMTEGVARRAMELLPRHESTFIRLKGELDRQPTEQELLDRLEKESQEALRGFLLVIGTKQKELDGLLKQWEFAPSSEVMEEVQKRYEAYKATSQQPSESVRSWFNDVMGFQKGIQALEALRQATPSTPEAPQEEQKAA